MANIEMVIDSIRTSLMNYQRVVVLKEKKGKRYLPIWIGPAEADAIAIKLQDVAVPRPLTHDMVLSIIKCMGGKVEMAICPSRFLNDTFYARLVLVTSGKRFEIDCRPSDAIAVAVRAKAPIFAEKSVLDKAGISLDEADKATVSQTSGKESGKLAMFSELARQALSLSEETAKRWGCDYVETKHLLLALCQQSESKAAKVLAGLGVELEKMQSAAKSSIIEENDAGLSVNVKRAINLAIDEVRHLNDPCVGTEHLLLGLIREGHGGAAKVLEGLGVNSDKVLAELLRLHKRGLNDSVERS